MKWFHLSGAPPSLTARGGGEHLFLISRQIKRTKDTEKYCCSVTCCFFASRIHQPISENINPDSLRMLMLVCATHIRCGRVTSYERSAPVLFAHQPVGVSPSVGAPAFDKRSSCTWPPSSLHCLHTRTTMNHRKDFFFLFFFFGLCVNHKSRTRLPLLIQASRRRRGVSDGCRR